MDNEMMDHMTVSLGYTGAANMAMLRMNEDYMKQQEIARRQNMAYLKEQKDVMTANANATVASAHAEAVGDYLQGGDHLAQAVVSGANAAGNRSIMKGQSSTLEEPQENLDNAKEFETKFNQAPQAGRGMGNAPRELTPAQKYRLQQIKDMPAGLKHQDSDRELLQHIKGNEVERDNFTKSLGEKTDTYTKEINTIVSNGQQRMQQMQTYFSIGQQALSAVFSGAKAAASAIPKGYADATRGLASTAEGNVQAILTQGQDAAHTYESQADQINRAREALARRG